MKRLFLLFAIVLPMAVLAQKSPVDKLFEKYANKEGFTTVNISGKLLGFASKLETGDDETSDMLSQLSGVRVLTADNEELTGKLDFYEELRKDGFFDNNDYEVLMEITEANEIVRFLGKDGGNGKFSDLILVIGGGDNTLISIQGVIDPENIGKITKSLDIDVVSNKQKE
ncbi:protein of unknown function [Mariniphaga anaerophila]|uniref:DUF4252 domain-containing protein n=1 Tax=Mariniphaga anaerophila TaxID=1484053 RepID=A0A1M4T6K9_9BACT|nr:DUF4252 domain-containing protein [Mariniphaga anaerophila]SHE40060.1 protein of unknown function [Mariniphaga anaerophila]